MVEGVPITTEMINAEKHRRATSRKHYRVARAFSPARMCDMTRSKNIDWAAIKTEHEQGISQRSLAAKYGISQASISKRAIKEQWVVQPVINAEVPLQLVTIHTRLLTRR